MGGGRGGWDEGEWECVDGEGVGGLRESISDIEVSCPSA